MAKKTKRPPRSPRDAMPLVLYVVKSQIESQDEYFGRGHFNDYDNGDRVGVYELRESEH